MGIWGVMTDYYAGDASIRMKDPTGRIVTVADIMFVFFITLLGIYGAPFRIPTAGKYYGILYEVSNCRVSILRVRYQITSDFNKVANTMIKPIFLNVLYYY